MSEENQPTIPTTPAMLFSAAGHVAALLLAIFGLPQLWESETRETAIPVAVVADIGQISQAPKVSAKPPTKKPDPDKPVQENPAVKNTAKPAEKPTPTAPKQSAATPPPAPEKPATKPAEKPAPAEKPTPDPTPQPVPAPSVPDQQASAEKPAPQDPPKQQTAAKPVPQTKPTPPKKTEKPAQKPEDDSFDDLLDDVSNLPKGEKTPDKPTNQTASSQEYNPAPAANTFGEKLTASEEDAIRAHVEQCWNLDTGMKDVETFKVGIRIAVTPDGTVTGAEIIERGQLGNPYFRAFAESGLRAVQRCSPLPVPRSKPYEVWQTMTLNFSAKDLLGF